MPEATEHEHKQNAIANKLSRELQHMLKSVFAGSGYIQTLSEDDQRSLALNIHVYLCANLCFNIATDKRTAQVIAELFNEALIAVIDDHYATNH